MSFNVFAPSDFRSSGNTDLAAKLNELVNGTQRVSSFLDGFSSKSFNLAQIPRDPGYPLEIFKVKEPFGVADIKFKADLYDDADGKVIAEDEEIQNNFAHWYGMADWWGLCEKDALDRRRILWIWQYRQFVRGKVLTESPFSLDLNESTSWGDSWFVINPLFSPTVVEFSGTGGLQEDDIAFFVYRGLLNDNPRTPLYENIFSTSGADNYYGVNEYAIIPKATGTRGGPIIMGDSGAGNVITYDASGARLGDTGLKLKNPLFDSIAQWSFCVANSDKVIVAVGCEPIPSP